MLSCPSCVNKAIPKEYQKTAESLFPPAGGTGGLEQALVFADILDIGADFRKLLGFEEPRSFGSSPNADVRKFLHSFQNNLDLLIQKTWVEKSDENRKEKLLERIPAFVALIEHADYDRALKEFGAILEELAWLLFGEQSCQEDFIEYAIRIDVQMGLFWWYAGQIGRVLPALKDRMIIRSILLLGLCYITDF